MLLYRGAWLTRRRLNRLLLRILVQANEASIYSTGLTSGSLRIRDCQAIVQFLEISYLHEFVDGEIRCSDRVMHLDL